MTAMIDITDAKKTFTMHLQGGIELPVVQHADNVALIDRYPDRIGYVHIKQMDPAIVARADRDGLAFGQAVAMGASCEPPRGEPVVEDVATALRALDRDLFVVVEQDMYPCDFGQPKPIAQRTYTYLRSLGIGED